MIASGRYLLDSEEKNGTLSVLVERNIITDNTRFADYADIISDDTILIFGQRYDIVGTHTSFGLAVPFLSIPEDKPLYELSIEFENPITRKKYDELVNRANEMIGMVMQDFALVEDFSVLENVMLPLNFARKKKPDRRSAAINALKSVGMDKFAKKPVSKLSGGQKQRVAIARYRKRAVDDTRRRAYGRA